MLVKGQVVIISTPVLHKECLSRDAYYVSDTQAPGDWLREQMERRRLSNRDVARAVGLRDQAVYYWLTGRTSPKDDAAAKLAELLNLPEREVRRRFGLWVPDETVEPPELDREQLREALDRFRRAADDLERLINQPPPKQ